MIVRSYRGVGFASAFGAAAAPTPCDSLQWEQFCDCKYASNPELRMKCKSKPWSCCPFGICPPWAGPNSDLGAACRGIPRENAGVLYGVQTVLSTISLVDKLVVPMQMNATAQKEAVVQQAQQQALVQAQTKKTVTSWLKYGALAVGGVATAAVLAEIVFPRPKKQLAGYRKRAR